MGIVNIDYEKISEALAYYDRKGFKYVEVPWVVDKNICDITKPENTVSFPFGDKDLVGSAEQSFLHLSLKEGLPPGAYVGASPCFRDEVEDQYHMKYFFKVELFDSQDVSYDRLLDILHCCHSFFSNYISCTLMKTDIGFDIVAGYNNVELGSYGIRSHQGFDWIYATGCAEPRLTQLLER